ncbi:hypothetical protein CVT26_005136 [Gymnopilus dilepis]|uniref:Ubiquitin-like domain-containing protein n=1 Tax=Gymnopilus dilepis TaxID=231916 RepID=A0A409YTG9_9AGAR|nr:hypothetical protein CVT26_005136 [Gymnopilus dilepis]
MSSEPNSKIQIKVIFQQQGTNEHGYQSVHSTPRRPEGCLTSSTPDSLRFYHNENRIRPEQSPAELGMEDGEEIDATLMQSGTTASRTPSGRFDAARPPATTIECQGIA